METQITEKDLILIIAILIAILSKTILNLQKYYNFLHLNDNFNNKLVNFYDRYSDLMNLLFIYIAYYIYFVRQTTNNIIIFLCVILIFRGFLHFIVNYKLYKPLNLSTQSEQNILNLHNQESKITNPILGLMSVYVLYKIFLI